MLYQRNHWVKEFRTLHGPLLMNVVHRPHGYQINGTPAGSILYRNHLADLPSMLLKENLPRHPEDHETTHPKIAIPMTGGRASMDA
jgi:hypothetical protein